MKYQNGQQLSISYLFGKLAHVLVISVTVPPPLVHGKVLIVTWMPGLQTGVEPAVSGCSLLNAGLNNS